MTSKLVIDFAVFPTARFPEDEHRLVHRLFQQAYQNANTAYREKSFSKLGYIALATVEQKLIGFALADTVRAPPWSREDRTRCCWIATGRASLPADPVDLAEV